MLFVHHVGKLQQQCIRRVSVPSRGTLLAIESSCDDTCAAVLQYDTSTRRATVLSDVIGSQAGIHAPYGGVVPHLAAQAHERHLPQVIAAAAAQADAAVPGAGTHPSLVAVTCGPGLVGCLRAGLRAAVQVAAAGNVPLLAVNHLEGHALVPRLQYGDALPFPYMVLLVSGGHSQLLLASGPGAYTLLASTMDDAVGEAFDKVARMCHVWRYTTGAGDDALQLQLEGPNVFTRLAAMDAEDVPARAHGNSLPLGAQLEALAARGNERAVEFPVPLRRTPAASPAFSFSGLKSAVQRYVSQPHITMNETVAADVAASFQRVATEHLVSQTLHCLSAVRAHTPVQALVMVGGVARNAYIRDRLSEALQHQGVAALFPPPRLCTDNAVMIAWAAFEHLCAAREAGVDALQLCVQPETHDSLVRARWPLTARPVWGPDV